MIGIQDCTRRIRAAPPGEQDARLVARVARLEALAERCQEHLRVLRCLRVVMAHERGERPMDLGRGYVKLSHDGQPSARVKIATLLLYGGARRPAEVKKSLGLPYPTINRYMKDDPWFEARPDGQGGKLLGLTEVGRERISALERLEAT